jgi:hypothetical protein
MPDKNNSTIPHGSQSYKDKPGSDYYPSQLVVIPRLEETQAYDTERLPELHFWSAW